MSQRVSIKPICPKCGKPCHLLELEPDGHFYARHGLRMVDSTIMGLLLCKK